MNNKTRILFERPDLQELNREYTVVDLHFHTHYTDGFASVKAIADRARELNIGIAVTDHNDIRGAIEIDRYSKVLSIPGIEVTSCEGTHLLVYFYDIPSLVKFYQRDIWPHMGADTMSSTQLEMEDIIERARKFESLIIFPHPYCGSYTGINNPYFQDEHFEEILSLADGVEVINSENLNKWNLKCALLGFNLGGAITGGSDGHRLLQMGKVVSVADCKKDRRDFLDAVKDGRNKVIGKEIDIIRKVQSNGSKLRSSMRNYPDFMEKNIKFINAKSKLIKNNMKRNLEERRKERRSRFKTY